MEHWSRTVFVYNFNKKVLGLFVWIKPCNVLIIHKVICID